MAGSSRRSRTCATVRPAGSDLELKRPSTITVTEAPRRSSPPSAAAISVAVSQSSSHARRVGRSLAGEGEGVRCRPRGAPWGWWSWVELVGACSNDPHDSEVRSGPTYYKERTAGKFYLLGRQYRCLGVGLRPEESGVSGARVTVISADNRNWRTDWSRTASGRPR